MPGTATSLEAKTVANYDATDIDSKTYDMYAPILNYKKAITVLKRPSVNYSWVPGDHLRRLKAYEILWSYWNNISRDFRMAPESGDDSQADDLLEMGDAEWLVGKLKAKLFGDDVKIAVHTDNMEEEIDVLLKLVTNKDIQDEEIKTSAKERAAEVQQKLALVPGRQVFLRNWWHDQAIFNIIDKTETKGGFLGDMVYYTYWDEAEKTVKIKSYDPGFCYPYIFGDEPDLSWDDTETEVSERMIVAWEESVTDTSFIIYREVYELRIGKGGVLRLWKQKARFEYGGEEKDLTSFGEDELMEGEALDWVDIGIDFMPFVWIPCIGVAGEEPFGISYLHFSICMLDSLINSYSDLTVNSEYLGGVTVLASGKNIKPRRDSTTLEPIAVEIQPRSMYYLGEDGNVTILDTSRMQTAIKETIEKQEEKFLRNNNIPDIVAGKMQSGQIPSGVALALMMQPLSDKISPIRQQRSESYSYLFYNVQRLFQLYGEPYVKGIFSGELSEVQLQYGPLIPSDDEASIKRYVMMQDLVDDKTILEIAKREGLNIDVDVVQKRLEEQREKKLKEQQDLFSMRRDDDESGNRGDQE